MQAHAEVDLKRSGQMDSFVGDTEYPKSQILFSKKYKQRGRGAPTSMYVSLLQGYKFLLSTFRNGEEKK